MLLQTYTTMKGAALTNLLPPFLNVGAEVTGDPAFSMFNLSLKGDWVADDTAFCHKMVELERAHEAANRRESQEGIETLEAQNRLDANKTKL